MDVNKLLGSYVNNIGSIVEWLFIVILVLFVPLLYFSFRKKPESTSSVSADLEETLKKVLEATRHQTVQTVVNQDQAAPVKITMDAATSPTPSPTASGSGPSESDMIALQAALADREKMISDLRGKMTELSATAKKEAAGGADTSGLDAKIKDLEARLKEYEIIEDDIANLSLYKEENARLKDELTKLRTAQFKSVEDIVTPAADDIAKEMGMTAGEPSESLATALEGVGGEQKIEMPELVPTAAPVQEAAPEGDSDLVNQFANLMDNSAKSEPTLAVAPSPELVATPQVATVTAPAAAPEGPSEGGGAADLLQGFDPEKIAEEAGALAEVAEGASTVVAEEGDQGQKLIDEFESFMKETKT